MSDHHRTLADTPEYTTKDGSIIQELLHPDSTTIRHQSIAMATVAPGETTRRHCHHQSEEVYYITAGNGVMELGRQRFTVTEGSAVVIPPGTPHAIHNDGRGPLMLLCCCAPPYRHDDTELL